MELLLERYSSGTFDTLGILYDATTHQKKFLCYTLEDEYRTTKKYGETRIPSGRYEIKLRTEGGHHWRYAKKFAAIHKGMLHLQDVPNFKFILIHIGNDDDDTAGCILVGDAVSQNVTGEGRLMNSTKAYKRVYTYILEALQSGSPVFINVWDWDLADPVDA